MAEIKISDLNETSLMIDTESLPLVQDSETKRITYSVLKANLFASPEFTGTVLAPTPTTLDKSYKVATTEYVYNRILNLSPLKDGTGATGLWNINISGNANTASSAGTLSTSPKINNVTFTGASDITVYDDTKILTTKINAKNGVAGLDSDGKVPNFLLPSYVDDVEEYDNLESFPVTAERGKIYVALDTNKCYRWSGSMYVYITSGAVDSVDGFTGVITKQDLAIDNVDNTHDINKNVLSATKLTTVRTIAASGDVTGSATNFDGTENITIPITLNTSGVSAGTYKSVTVNSKGLITDGTNPTTLSGYGITDATPSSHIGSTGSSHGQVTTSVNGFMSSTDKTKLDSISASANNYSLPIATAIVLGGVKQGTGTTIAGDGSISVNYGINSNTACVGNDSRLSDARTPTAHLTTAVSAHSDWPTTVSITELGYLGNVTSDIQTQLNTKAPSASPTFSGTVTLPSTTSIGTVSSTEISYLDTVSSNIQSQLNGKEPSLGFTPENIANKGVSGGYASLDSSGKVPSSQLPSYVDDVEEYASTASFPAIGESGKIYVAIDTKKLYRWSGSAYIYITSGAVDSVNGYTGVVNLTYSDVGAAPTAGSTNITTLGTVTSGTWSASTIAVAKGGTGVTTSTGTGSVVLSTSPTLTTPNIGVASGTSFNSITALSSTSPNMDGTATVGTSTTVARSDHIHPTDTSRSPVAGSTSITTLGTVTSGTWSATAIAANKGGTGQTAYTVGDLLYASTTSALSKLAASTSGYVLTSNGAGTAPSWQASAAGGATGGGSNAVFYENDTTVTTNYTITSGKNAMSAGPITINTGIIVTIPDGSVWTIV